MQMIDNSLTVNIEEDMQQRANISPPKQVTRLGTSTGFKPGASRGSSPLGKQESKSASKIPTYKSQKSNPVNMRLHTEFGIDMGGRLFRNEEFEKRIAEVQRKIEEFKQQGPTQAQECSSPGIGKSNFISKDCDEEQVDEFYKDMKNFYKNPAKHQSPTRRLRQ